MIIRSLIYRLVILAVFLAVFSQFGGTAVRADRDPVSVARNHMRSIRGKLAERFCRKIGAPHSGVDAGRLLMRAVR